MKMKLNIELENLTEIIRTTMDENIKTTITKVVQETTKEYILQNYKQLIEETANKQMLEYLNTYLSTATITTGGGLYSKEPAITYTIDGYLKKELATILQDGVFKIKEKDRYGDYKTTSISFDEFIKQSFDMNKLVEEKLKSFMDKTRKEINNSIDTTFTGAAKSMLSEAVYNVLLKNETFSKIKSNVKCLANGNDNV